MSLQSTTTAKFKVQNLNGEDIMQIMGQGGNMVFNITANGGIQISPILITANGPINPSMSAPYVITKNGIAALTLAAPGVGADDGIQILIASATAFAHTLTTPGLLLTGTASINTASFQTNAGSSLTLMAYQGKWIVISTNGTISYT